MTARSLMQNFKHVAAALQILEQFDFWGGVCQGKIAVLEYHLWIQLASHFCHGDNVSQLRSLHLHVHCIWNITPGADPARGVKPFITC